MAKAPHLSRRAFSQLTIGGLISAASMLHPGAIYAAAKRKKRQPNIVFIMADDMGYADISCNGRNAVQTPNIDRIAETGINLHQAYANSAVCSASRLALITGRYQYRLPLGLEEPLAGADVGLPPEVPTLPSLLKRAGYRTMLIGKWHLGSLPKYGPSQSGYDQFFGFRGGALDYFTNADIFGKPDLWDGDTATKTDGYLTDVFGKTAVQAIDTFKKDTQPFLLSLHFNAPHWPWEGPQDIAEAKRIHEAGFSLKFDLDKTGLRHFDGGSRAIYEEMIAAMDRQVGQVLDALERNGLRENTIVVFTSDNGGERFADMWPFSGQKTELLEGGLRVPALVSWPGALPQKTVNQQVMMTMDWMPTLLAAAGAKPDPASPTDGMDLSPILAGAAEPVSRSIYFRYKANHQRAVRSGNYKYLQIAGNSYLFDVVADPRERANLKRREPETFEKLRSMWKEWNRGMLPERDETFTEGVLSEAQADHIGAVSTIKTADPGN